MAADQIQEELLLGARRPRKVPGERTPCELRLLADHGQPLSAPSELHIDDIVEPAEVGVGAKGVLNQVTVDHPANHQVGVQAPAAGKVSRVCEKRSVVGVRHGESLEPGSVGSRGEGRRFRGQPTQYGIRGNHVLGVSNVTT